MALVVLVVLKLSDEFCCLCYQCEFISFFTGLDGTIAMSCFINRVASISNINRLCYVVERFRIVLSMFLVLFMLLVLFVVN